MGHIGKETAFGLICHNGIIFCLFHKLQVFLHHLPDITAKDAYCKNTDPISAVFAEIPDLDSIGSD